MSFALMPLIRNLLLLALAAAVSGCAQNGTAGLLGGGSSGRPKSVVVSDFVVASELPAFDRGFSERTERRNGNLPILERKQRTLARVNDEIIADVVAVLRDGGLQAEPGSEASLTLGDNVLLVRGALRAPEHKPATRIGFGPGRGAVTADMTLSQFSSGAKRPLLTFVVEGDSLRRPSAVSPQMRAARNAEIADALAAEDAAPEKLSPDVEAQARAIGGAIGEKILAYAKEHDWLAKPEAAAGAAAMPERQVRVPDARPPQRSAGAKKPAADPRAPEDEEPPDTEVPADRNND